MKAVPLLLASDRIALVNGRDVAPDHSRLENPFRTPMLIDEVRFILDAGGSGNLGGGILCQLTLGPYGLTNGFVPIWSFGQQISRSGGANAYVPFTPEIMLGAAGTSTYSFFRWKLPKPLFIADAAVLQAKFRRADATTRSGTNGLRIAYLCRRLPAETPSPAEIDIPYVSTFIAPYGARTDSTSNALDLKNPFAKDFNVQRFVARWDSAGAGESNNALFGAVGGTYRPVASPAITIKDNKENYIVRDFIAPGLAVDMCRRGWTAPRVLKQNDNFTVVMQFNPADAADLANSALHFSMIGYRREPVL